MRHLTKGSSDSSSLEHSAGGNVPRQLQSPELPQKKNALTIKSPIGGGKEVQRRASFGDSRSSQHNNESLHDINNMSQLHMPVTPRSQLQRRVSQQSKLSLIEDLLTTDAQFSKYFMQAINKEDSLVYTPRKAAQRFSFLQKPAPQ